MERLSEGIGAALGGLAAFLWGLIEDAWKSVIEWWNETAFKDGKFTIEGLLNGMLEAIKGIGEWILSHIFKPFFEGFAKAFGIHSPSTVMAELGGYIVEGLKKGISDKWDNFIQFWDKKKKDIIEKFKDIKERFLAKGKTIIAGIREGISNKWASFSTFWVEKKNSIVDKFSGIRDKFIKKGKNVIDGIWSGISEKWPDFSKKWTQNRDDIVDKFSDIKSSMTNVGVNIVSGIIDGIKSVWNTLKSWASSIVDMFSIKVNTSGSGTTASQTSRAYSRSYMQNYQNNPAFAAFDTSKIPGYATGQVIPRTMRRHLAILGDNKRETEVVSPLSTIEKAVENALSRNGGAGKEITIKVPVYLDGKQIYEAVIKQGKVRQMATGNNGFMLGTT